MTDVDVYAVYDVVNGHRYLSTGCLHGKHDYCQSDRGAAGEKIPAQCKFCGTPCLCWCHREQAAA